MLDGCGGCEARDGVLIVDDDPDFLSLSTDLVTALGHRSLAASCGRDALALAERSPPSVVLLDLGLRDMTGYEVARELRRSPGGDAVLVAVTGFGGSGELESTRAAGFDQHVVKPIGLPELRWIIGAAAPASARRSLLVIDEPAVAASLARVLAKSHAGVVASTRDEVLEQLEARAFDHILCAARTARRLGPDVVHALCARGAPGHLVWMTDGATRERLPGRALRKPFGRAALLDALGVGIDRHAGASLERRERADGLLATFPADPDVTPMICGRMARGAANRACRGS
jgi:CheY-like chemotaxis protein